MTRRLLESAKQYRAPVADARTCTRRKPVPAETQPHETLDPSDWHELRALGHRMLDDMFTYLQERREQPVWQPIPDQIRDAFQAPLPREGEPAADVYEQFRRDVLPYVMGNTHPRFWGWVMGPGTPLGMLADMLAAGVNPNMGGGDHTGSLVEAQVVAWCKELMGFPATAGGVLVTGGSTANLVALTVARYARSPFDVREDGVAAAPARQTLYGSEEMHSSLQRAVELLGLGRASLRQIPVDADDRIDISALRRTIADDIAAGCTPLCLIGNAGTTNTGAIDPLDVLADIAVEHDLWFHVDGAFGALAYLSPELRPLLAGMERADSLAFDLHKWGYLPFEVGCVLVRDAEAHRRTFTLRPDYLQHAERGLAGGSTWFSDYDIQLTRGFRALKVWMTFKNEGVEKIGRLIRQDVSNAEYLAGLIEASPRLELLAPVLLNVVCFRFTMPGLDGRQLDALNEELLMRLQESGIAVPSGTHVRGRYALRCSMTNHRSRREDFDILAAAVERIGEAIAAGE
jgi:aromatic-L-amino-acid decarboxylase